MLENMTGVEVLEWWKWGNNRPANSLGVPTCLYIRYEFLLFVESNNSFLNSYSLCTQKFLYAHTFVPIKPLLAV